MDLINLEAYRMRKQIAALLSERDDVLNFQNALALKCVPWTVSVKGYLDHCYHHSARELDVIMVAGESQPTSNSLVERVSYHQRFTTYTPLGMVVAFRQPQPLLSAYYHIASKSFTDSLGVLPQPDPLEKIVKEAVRIAGYAIQSGYDLAKVYVGSPPSIPQLRFLLSLDREKMEGYKELPAPKFFVV